MRSITIKAFLTFVTIVNCTILWSQPVTTDMKHRPKVGLALSGGGAKGLAHIGLLKLIDSLGIKVDYITGTSMGGILGGLYAMGYSADQLEDIAMHIDWPRVLSNKVPLNEINCEEKSEYANYMIEFPVVKGRPSLPNALVEGQYMSEILNTFTFPARGIRDFSKLPIPVETTSSDIVNGGLVLQKKGSLPLAIRATLAIPAAFSPVYIDGKLLVDGGMDRNFPVQEVKDMGADIVIGGYTGFRLFTEKEIENPFKMIYQTHAFRSVEDSRKQMSNTDVLIDFTQAIYDFTTADFTKYKGIIEAGKTEARKHLPALLKLAKEQKVFGEKVQHELVKETFQPTIKYNFLTDRNIPITDTDEIKMLQELIGLKPGAYYPVTKVNEGISRIYGTRYYKKVYYTYINTHAGLEMNIHLKQREKGSFKAAIHYDTDQKAGILLNYTYYNLFLKRSRFLATIDAAERLKARLNYYKFITRNNKLWAQATYEYRNIKSNDFLLSLQSVDQVTVPDYFNKLSSVNIGLGYSFNKSMYIESGIGYETENLQKKPDLLTRLFGLGGGRSIYKHNDMAVYFRIVQNNMNAQYYPTKGNKLTAEAKYIFANHLDIAGARHIDSTDLNIYSYLNPKSDFYNPSGEPGDFVRLFINEQYAFPVCKKLTITANGFTGVNYSNKSGINPNSYIYFNNKFGLGGIDARDLPSNPNFIGLKQNELPLNSITAFSVSAQYNPVSKLYILPTVSYGWWNESFNIFSNAFNQGSDMFGYGLHIGYLSMIGPVDFSISKVESNMAMPWRGYFSFGFKF